MNDIKGKELSPKDYVLIENPLPGEKHLQRGDLGRVCGITQEKDINVAVYHNGEVICQYFHPGTLRRIDEKVLISGRLPDKLNRNRVLGQYAKLRI